jgi:serine/threonine-protein kinase
MGKGGKGEVWRARHRLLVRPAAVKLIRRDALRGLTTTTPDRVLRRFAREAQATAQLECPHSIQLYDFGTTRDGSFFYVMELLNGLDLETLVERFGPQPAERCVYLLRQACHSLEEAHSRGLLHRDIKPANIFCCRYGIELDWVKVLDFGLVYGEGDTVSQTKLTAEGTVTGTPAFMAPEALMGDAALDARTDLYALGCVAYWLISGRMVFEAPSPMKLALMHVDKPPVPPSQVTELPVPPDLDRLILDLLAKRPADRPASAAYVSARLEAIRLDSPWTQERARAWWMSHLPERATATAPLGVANSNHLTPAHHTLPE